MFNYKTIHEAYGNYGSNGYMPLPEHKKWRLGDLVTEMSDFYKYYGATGGGSQLSVYRYDHEWDRYFYHPSKDCPLFVFNFAYGHSGLVETECLSDPEVSDLEVYCDLGIGFWGCDTWYAYLATPPEQETDQSAQQE